MVAKGLRWGTLVLWATCVIELRAEPYLLEPQPWYLDPVTGSRSNGIVFAPSTGVLYEVGIRSRSLNTGAMLGSIDFYLRGHHADTGNVTIELQNGTSSYDGFAGECFSVPVTRRRTRSNEGSVSISFRSSQKSL